MGETSGPTSRRNGRTMGVDSETTRRNALQSLIAHRGAIRFPKTYYLPSGCYLTKSVYLGIHISSRSAKAGPGGGRQPRQGSWRPSSFHALKCPGRHLLCDQKCPDKSGATAPRQRFCGPDPEPGFSDSLECPESSLQYVPPPSLRVPARQASSSQRQYLEVVQQAK
jgi:hypothetical protein